MSKPKTSASPTPSVTKTEESQKAHRISKEDEERLTDSLFRVAIEKKKKSLEEIEKSVYKYEEPKVLTREQAEASALRQCTEEMDRRKKKHEELMGRHQPTTDTKVLNPEDLQSSIQRVYEDAMRIKKDKVATLRQKQEEADKKLMVTGKTTISKEQMQACGDRLSKPVKRQYTLEEYNSICVYGV